MSVYDEGYLAYLNAPRCPYDMNTPEEYVWFLEHRIVIPYDKGTKECTQWHDGWLDATFDGS